MHIQHDRICGIRLQNESAAIINIFCVYLPARGCDDDIVTTLDELSAILDNSEICSHNIICGDLNADMGIKVGCRSKKTPDKRGIILYNFAAKYSFSATNLSRMATGPIDTHYGPTGQTCIDYVLVPSYLNESISTCVTLDNEPLNTSDHLPVRLSIDLGTIPQGSTEGLVQNKIRWDKMDSHAKFMKYEAPLGTSISELLSYISGVVPTPDLIDESVETLIGMIRYHDQQVPRSRFKKNIKSFWCDELNELIKLGVMGARGGGGGGGGGGVFRGGAYVRYQH